MKALVNTGPGRLEFLDWPTPRPGLGQVRIRTDACGICATDLEMIGGWKRTGFPSIPGHEWTGTVEAAGAEADSSLIGRRCVAENVLTDGGEVGFEHPGGYGEYFITEARHIRVLPNDFPAAVASLIEPLAVSVRALRRLRLENRSSAAIFGDGPIGLIMLMLLKHEGVGDIVLVGGRESRLCLARELGAAAVLNYHDLGGWLSQTLLRLPCAPYANIVEASGSAEAMETGMAVCMREGKVLVIGDYGDSRASFRWNQVLHQELELIGCCASAGAWDAAVDLAVHRLLPLERLISQTVPAAEGSKGVELVRTSRDVIKVILEWSASRCKPDRP